MYAPVLPLMSAQTAKEEKVNPKRAELSTELDFDLWEYRRRRTRPTVDSTEKKRESLS